MPIGIAYAEDPNVTAAAQSTSSVSPARDAAAGGMFHSLFQTGERREAVSPAISELWGTQARVKAPDASSPPAAASRDKDAGEGFVRDLFRDQSSSFRPR
jgi:hypothetical protein